MNTHVFIFDVIVLLWLVALTLLAHNLKMSLLDTAFVLVVGAFLGTLFTLAVIIAPLYWLFLFICVFLLFRLLSIITDYTL
jgi:hypothetical protein